MERFVLVFASVWLAGCTIGFPDSNPRDDELPDLNDTTDDDDFGDDDDLSGGDDDDASADDDDASGPSDDDDLAPDDDDASGPTDDDDAGGCGLGEVEDCLGGCTLESWIGDGVCDPSLDCAAFSFDDGDCAAGDDDDAGPSDDDDAGPADDDDAGGCAADEVEDCLGGCTLAAWVGDGICDTSLDCAAFSFDGGDCASGDDDDAAPDDDDTIADDDDTFVDDDDTFLDDDDTIATDDDDATPPPPTCADDGYEDNDTDAAAASIATGAYYGLQVCDGDDDYYAVNLGAGTGVTFDLSFSDAEGDVDLRLYDPAGTYVASSLSVSDDESIAPFSTAASGDWIVKVDLWSDDGSSPGNSYDLVIGTPGCQPDAYEPNESSGTATSTGSFAWTDYGVGLCDGDVDWYSRDLASGETIEIDVFFEDDAGDLDLEIYDHNALWAWGSYSSSDDESLTYAATGAGTHWFRVYLYDDPGDPGQGYDLAVDSY